MGEKGPIGCYFICCENNTVAAAAAVDLKGPTGPKIKSLES